MGSSRPTGSGFPVLTQSSRVAEKQRCLGVGSLREHTDEQNALTTKPPNHKTTKPFGRAEHVDHVDVSRWGKGKGFLGMGRTKGTKGSKGTKGRFTGASREGSGWSSLAWTGRSSGEAPLCPLSPLRPFSPNNPQQTASSQTLNSKL